ncbi:DUF1499 domain-containing protein [Methylobacterium planeticum]|uniref:DUF1499 domain-containing protein n=1 Tax=Methylobacterium planeticum TaxID=2615211 RepID=A0A6N6MBS5_9HYPH|nr:DUF1499 domain-containing protein [Methylobacterium planeticum]
MIGVLGLGSLGLGSLGLGLAVLVARGSEPGGIEEAWMLLFGAPDLGPVDFPTLTRTRLPVDGLACPPGHCERARADLTVPVLPVPGDRLRAIVAEVAAETPRTDLVFRARWTEEDRYLTRSSILHRPATINVAIIGAGEGRSTLALYSRSQIALADFGSNRARLAAWLERIGERARREGAR